MIRAIIRFLIIFFIIAFVAVWLLGGGLEQIKVSTTHYRNPFDSHNIFEFVFGTGTSSVGETFHLPGQPSSFSTLDTNAPASSTVQVYSQSNAVDTGAGDLTPQQQLENLQAQYVQLKAEQAAQQ